jgi:lactate dehydrogenase-like 2-hydroxyacid dehydrogenase
MVWATRRVAEIAFFLALDECQKLSADTKQMRYNHWASVKSFYHVAADMLHQMT